VAAEQAVWQKLTSDGDAAKAAGDLKKAEASYQAAVEEAKKLGETDPTFARTTANLADFYYAQGDGAQADRLYKQSLSIHEKALGLEHADLVQSILGLARVTASQKNYAESVAHYERAIAILNKNKMPVSPEVQAEYTKAKESAATSKGSTKEPEAASKDSVKESDKEATAKGAKDKDAKDKDAKDKDAKDKDATAKDATAKDDKKKASK
ncbi:MAG: tetratricopeptide repeat protein, partial [Candidatus Melainabacteria bacterium]|nr:tetratricopeptide repeat protein [Candidatus Melainabacteria bacterium]